MKLISEHIKLLLHEHECVIVPGLGGFIKNRQAAAYRKEQHEFSPVAHLPFFNKQLKNNDGLLAASLVERDKLSYSQAIKEISRFVDFVKDELLHHRVISLKGLGKLSMNQDDQVTFLPDENVNLNMNAFGLSVIQVQPVKRSALTGDSRPAIKPERKRNRKFVVPFITVLLLAGGAWTYFYNDNAIPKQLGILNPFEFDSSEIKNPAPADTKKDEPVPAETPEVNVEEQTEEIIAPEVIPAENTVETTSAGDSAFYIVVGAFSKQANAANFEYILKEKGFSAVTYNGDDSKLIRVCAEQHSIRFEAEERLTYIQRVENKDAWILAVKK